MTRNLYVYETNYRGYQLVEVFVDDAKIEDLRKLMRGLVLKGQRRVHMKKENDSRRRAIAAAICGCGVRAVVYAAGRRYDEELGARAACLQALVIDQATEPTLLVVEQDDSLLRWDRQRLIELRREADCRETLTYRHQRAASEALLALPDAVAWCWAKGGDWRRRISPAVTVVRQI
jgi:hypothetical protein